MQSKSKIILGIDPGTVVLGYGLISIKSNKPVFIDMGVLRLAGESDHYQRLGKIYQKIQELIVHYKPEYFAIEAPFFGKNVQSMLKLGRAQGVAIAAAMQAGLSVCEYSPKRVKQSITGNGNASKEQVMKMLQTLLSLGNDAPQYYDASDALAVAMCHHYEHFSMLSTGNTDKKLKGWKDFIAQNPQRLKGK